MFFADLTPLNNIGVSKAFTVKENIEAMAPIYDAIDRVIEFAEIHAKRGTLQ